MLPPIKLDESRQRWKFFAIRVLFSVIPAFMFYWVWIAGKPFYENDIEHIVMPAGEARLFVLIVGFAILASVWTVDFEKGESERPDRDLDSGSIQTLFGRTGREPSENKD